MKEFFSQFGDVKTVFLARSKRTGKSKHFAFIEFMSPEVAEIVAETMDNYLMEGKVVFSFVVNDFGNFYELSSIIKERRLILI